MNGSSSLFDRLSVIKSLCDLVVFMFMFIKEDCKMKTALVTVGTGVSGVAKYMLCVPAT